MRDGRVLITPVDYTVKSTHGDFDCMGVVRKQVVEHWMSGRTDYFRIDGQMWFRMSLAFNQLFVDEPWGRFHTDAPGRISESTDARNYTDFIKFVEQYRPELGTEPCQPLDEFLKVAWIKLWRGKESDKAAVVREWMNERSLSTTRTIVEFGLRKIDRLVRSRPVQIIDKPTDHH